MHTPFLTVRTILIFHCRWRFYLWFIYVFIYGDFVGFFQPFPGCVFQVFYQTSSGVAFVI